MKLGIFMLLVGLILAGLGLFSWVFATSVWDFAITPGTVPPHWFSSYEQIALVKAIGMGVALFGGGLALGGLVRMIVKR